MARYEFSWATGDDGEIFSRSTRQVPFQATLIMKDLDNPEAPDARTLVRASDPATLSSFLLAVTAGVNASLNY